MQKVFYKDVKTYIFLGIFLAAFFNHHFNLNTFGFVDRKVWANEAKYVQTNDPQEFDMLGAYGHPGAPIIDLTITLHSIFKIPYDKSVILGLSFIDAFIIAAVVMLCYILRPKNLWWLAVAAILMFNWLFWNSTPPTVLASLLAVLIFLFSLKLYEQKRKIIPREIVLWGLIAGLLVATRTDIGSIIIMTMAIFLWKKIDLRSLLFMGGALILVFVVVNPFMWFMPLQHIHDLVSKVVYHYGEYKVVHLSFFQILLISPFAFISMLLSVIFLAFRKKMPFALPAKFILATFLMTGILSAILLTANFQTQRYFYPIAFIWETFLPLYIFVLLPKARFSFIKSEQGQVKAQYIIQGLTIFVFIGYMFLSSMHLNW